MPQMDPVFSWTASAWLALVFAASAIIKLVDLDEFRSAVENYRVIPESMAPESTAAVVAIAVPLLELAAAVGIMIPRTHFEAAMVLMLLLAAFTAAISINLFRGRLNVDCGCFGPALRQRLSWWLVARNLGMIAIGMIATVPYGRPLAALDVMTIIFGASTLVVLYAAMNYALANAPLLSALETADA
jgi:uncharacterized membrane protein